MTGGYVDTKVYRFVTKMLDAAKQNFGHLFDVKLEYFFHVHRDADENHVVAPVVARVRRNNCPDWA